MTGIASFGSRAARLHCIKMVRVGRPRSHGLGEGLLPSLDTDLKKLLSVTIVTAILLAAIVDVSGDPSERDQFGGWTELSFEATGYFRLEEADQRWWLVTPEGNAFVIHGMDHCGPQVTNHNYNRDHWNRDWGLGENPNPSARLEAFYRNKVASDRDYLGFNTVYSHSAPVGMNIVPSIPRARTLNIEYWRTHSLRKQNPPMV